jgi:hypothetical protein
MFVTIEVTIFAVALIVGLLGFSSLSDVLSFICCLCLAPSFVAMMVSVHHFAPAEKKVWSHLGVAFSIIYAVLCAITYYTQLVVVRANSLGVSSDAMALFTFEPGSFLFAADMLGYGFMTLATLASAPVFGQGALERWLRRWFILHGLFALPTVIFPAFNFAQDADAMASTDMFGTLALLLWCAIFVPIPILLATLYRRLTFSQTHAAARSAA